MTERSERDQFIGSWVSQSEKNQIKEEAEKKNVSISELIRQRVTKDNIDNTEILYILMDYVGQKFDEIKNLILEQNENNGLGIKRPPSEPIKPTQLRRPEPIEKPEKQIVPKNFMGQVLDELKGKLEEIKERFGIED
jgi:hypothetical protein